MRKPPDTRIGFLYLNTGGGHLSAARALHESIREKYGERAHCFSFNPVPRERILVNLILEEGYRFSTTTFRPLWTFLYEVSKCKTIQRIWDFIMYRITRLPLRRFLRENKIDAAVILHFLLIRPAVRCISGMKEKPKLIRIVTDPFTAHDMWFSPPRMHTILFSDELLKTACSDFSLPREKIRVVPPLIGKEFGVSCAETAFPLHGERRRCILFLSGGEGLPRALRFIKKVLKSDMDVNILLVCGKDVRLRKRGEKLMQRHTPSRLRVLGYVDYIHDILCTADLVVTKAGPAVIWESLLCGKPLLLIHYHYGQEKGNLRFVLREGVGLYSRRPSVALNHIMRFLSGTWEWTSIRANIDALSPENGIDAASKLVYDFARTGHLG